MRCVLQGFGVRHVLNPDAYRGRFGNDGAAYAEDVDDVIRHATSGRVAGFISESIQGVGGSIPLADGYLPKVYEVGKQGFKCWYSPIPLLARGSMFQCFLCLFWNLFVSFQRIVVF